MKTIPNRKPGPPDVGPGYDVTPYLETAWLVTPKPGHRPGGAEPDNVLRVDFRDVARRHRPQPPAGGAA